MGNEKISLPASKLEDVETIIAGYAQQEKEVTNDDVKKVTGISSQMIGRNKNFLGEVGIIEGGRKKNITPRGKDLGKAIEHNQEDIVITNWRKIIENNEFLSGIITTVRLKKGMSKEDLEGHILYAANATSNQWNKRGAKTVIQIFEKSGFLDKENGQYEVSKISTEEPEEETEPEETTAQNNGSPQPIETTVQRKVKRDGPTISINIELQLPKTDDPVIYDNLFKALNKHLLDNNGSDE